MVSTAGAVSAGPPPWGVRVTVIAGSIALGPNPLAVNVTVEPTATGDGVIFDSVNTTSPSTSNAFGRVIWESPVTITVRGPSAAPGRIVIFAVTDPLPTGEVGPKAP